MADADSTSSNVVQETSPEPTQKLPQENTTERKSRKEGHVKFNPEVQVANLIFQSEGAPDEFGIPVHVRLHKVAEQAVAEKAAAVKAADEHRAKQIDRDCTFQPIIQDGKAADPVKINWDIFLQEQADFVKRNAKKKQEIKADMVRDETTVPKNKELPRKTHNKIINYLTAQHKYHGTVTDWDRHFASFVARREPSQGHLPRSVKQKPSGSVNPVFDKLYEESALREAAQRVFLQTQLEKEFRELYKPSTNESFLMDDQTASSVSNRSVELDLIRKGEEYKRKREKMLKERQMSVEHFPFKPQTNPKSREIILKKALEQEQLALTGPLNLEPEVQNLDLSEVKGIQLSKPRCAFDVDLFTSKVQRRQALRHDRIAQLRREQKVQEVAECTFRPSISKHSDELQRQRTFIDPFPPVAIDRRGYLQNQEHTSPRLSPADVDFRATRGEEELHLQNLEDELRGVIAEWRYISGDA